MELKMQVSNNQNLDKFPKKEKGELSNKLITRKEQKLKTMRIKALQKFIKNNQN